MRKPFPPPPRSATPATPRPTEDRLASKKPSPLPDPPKTTMTREEKDRYLIEETLDMHLKPKHRDDPIVLNYINAYLDCRDNRQASKRVGIHPSTGRSLRNKNDIHRTILKLTDLFMVRSNLDPTEIITKVKEVMEVDVGDFQNEDGSFKESLHDLEPEVRRAVKKFEAKNIYSTDPNGMRTVVGKVIKVEVYDKLKATELLGREEGLFKDTKVLEVGPTSDMKNILLSQRERAAKRIKDVNG